MSIRINLNCFDKNKRALAFFLFVFPSRNFQTKNGTKPYCLQHRRLYETEKLIYYFMEKTVRTELWYWIREKRQYENLKNELVFEGWELCTHEEFKRHDGTVFKGCYTLLRPVGK